MGDTIKRTRPAGRSRKPLITSTAPRMSPSAGRRRAMSCSPAGVGATLRVVRASRRTPNRSSSPRIAWLIAEADTPRRFAARVKLRSSATARNADRTLSSSRTICEWYSQTLVDFPGYSGQKWVVTLRLEARSNAEAQTWKEPLGSVSAGARLHGHELRLRSGGGQAGDDLADSLGRRTRCEVLRHGRSLWPVHQ